MADQTVIAETPPGMQTVLEARVDALATAVASLRLCVCAVGLATCILGVAGLIYMLAH